MKENSHKTTILTLVIGFLLLYLLFSWRWSLYVSFSIGVIGIISPYLSEKIHKIWIKFSAILGFIVPKILLSIVFYFVLVPISFLFRMFNKDPLMLSDKYDSYFITVNRDYDTKSFENTW